MTHIKLEEIPLPAQFLQALKALEHFYKTGERVGLMSDEELLSSIVQCPLCWVAKRFDRHRFIDCRVCPWVIVTGAECENTRKFIRLNHRYKKSACELRDERNPAWVNYRLKQLAKWIPLYEEAARLQALKTMSKDHAILAMRRGLKVTHELFTSTEWMASNGTKYVFEDGFLCTPARFWEGRTGDAWQQGWRLYEEHQTDTVSTYLQGAES